jgi:hypothetical protein
VEGRRDGGVISAKPPGGDMGEVEGQGWVPDAWGAERQLLVHSGVQLGHLLVAHGLQHQAGGEGGGCGRGGDALGVRFRVVDRVRARD